MGHRHMFNVPQIFEGDSDQGWNHAEQPLMHTARASAPEKTPLVHSMCTLPVQGGYYFNSQWNTGPRSNGFSSSVLNSELTSYQPLAPGPSRDPFLHPTAPAHFHFLHENYSYHSSPDYLCGQPVNKDDGYHVYPTMGSVRGPYKRKCPGNHQLIERGSSSRNYDVGSSSSAPLPVDPWEEKQIAEAVNTTLGYMPAYRANTFSIGNDSSLRNVRRRTEDLETIQSGTQLPLNSLHSSFSDRYSDQFNSMDVWGDTSNASTRSWNHDVTLYPGHELTYGSDSSYFTHVPDTLNTPNNNSGGSMEFGGNIDINSNINPISQNVNNNQTVRGVRSGYGNRSIPSIRSCSSNLRPGHTAVPDEEPHVGENYPSIFRRTFPAIRMRSIGRNGRMLISSDRRRSSAEEVSFRDRMTPEGLMMPDHQSGFYGYRNHFDQHREMRLDTENMSYEDLLALGERIGIVNTGLSEELIPKCLTASIYCSSDLCQDEETCIICLEEYKNMDDVGSLKACGHNFHVTCIRKWLSIKNLCPICKTTALDDSMKNR